jgi:Fe-S cluster biogenesis protein NfuA
MDVSITKQKTMQERVLDALDYLRPALHEDGGDIDLVSVDEDTGRVEVALFGACDGCPIANVTVTQGVERIIKDRVPGVTEVVTADAF